MTKWYAKSKGRKGMGGDEQRGGWGERERSGGSEKSGEERKNKTCGGRKWNKREMNVRKKSEKICPIQK